MDPEGRHIRSLPYDFDTVTDISWSPDGAQLAVRATDLVESSDYRVGIWVVDVDGDEQRLLVAGDPRIHGPRRPVPIVTSGRMSSLVACRGLDRFRDGGRACDPCSSHGSDGSNVRPIACGFETGDGRAPSSDPEWSPDGQVVYCSSSYWEDGKVVFEPQLRMATSSRTARHRPPVRPAPPKLMSRCYHPTADGSCSPRQG